MIDVIWTINYYDDEDRKRFIAQHDASGENVALSLNTWRKKTDQ